MLFLPNPSFCYCSIVPKFALLMIYLLDISEVWRQRLVCWNCFQGFLDQECVPIGYSGLVSHLHYQFNPSKFVLVSLLVKGLFYKLCVPTDIKGDQRCLSHTLTIRLLVHAHPRTA